VAFDVAAESYDAFMGRHSVQLAPGLADLAGVTTGQRVLDVGCGPGTLTGELVRRCGPDAVSAVDPSEPFVAAARARHPGVDVRLSSAEQLPFAEGEFDAALAQLVVHFMTDPVGGIGEMRRVTRAGGAVVASVWDLAGGRAPLSPFWSAAAELRPDVVDESRFPGAREGHLRELFRAAGLRDVEETTLSSSAEFSSFGEWWEPYTLGVGPAGAYAQKLDEDELADLRERCRERLPEAPFTLESVAWAARGTA
jgi:SAM-dependent methyltransferase